MFGYKYKAHFPSIGSDDPPPSPPLGIENVKIQENYEKIRGPSTTLFRALGGKIFGA